MLIQSLVLVVVLSQATPVQSAGGGDVGEVVAGLQSAHQDAGQLSNQVAGITGTQLSPVLVMAASGGLAWSRASAEERGRLPWHQQPWFWGTAILVILVVLFGQDLPGVGPGVRQLKLFESKIGFVLAAIATIGPLTAAASQPVHQALAAVSELLVPSALAADGGSVGGGILVGAAQVIAVVLAVAVSGTVWLAGHSINVLSVLIPFAPINIALRLGRLVLVGVLLLAAQLSPAAGLLVAGVYIFVAFLLAGWSFRLMVFGAVFSTDYLLFKNQAPSPSGVEAFTSMNLPGVPVRTYGTIVREGAALVFRYRPLLVMSKRQLALPQTDMMGRSIFSPVLLLQQADGQAVLLRFPPRYRRQIEPLSEVLGVSRIADVGILRGLKAAIAWFKGKLPASGPPPLPPPLPG